MENKLEQLTKRLYEEGLTKGRAEADTLVGEAHAQADRILADARAKADEIVREARTHAEELMKNTNTEIMLAGKQTITAIKEGIADMIIARTTSTAIAEATVDAAFIKELLLAVAANWNGSSSEKVSLTALLPASKEKDFEKAFENSAKQLLDAGIEISYRDNVKSGFKVGPRNGGYHISFTDADFNALFDEYLRPKVSQLLYGEQ